MSIFIGIAVAIAAIISMLLGFAGGEMTPRRRPHLALRSRRDTAEPEVKVHLLLEGENFAPDSEVRFIAWHLPDGHGFYRKEPVESARVLNYRSSSFDDVAFEPAITLAAYTGEGEPHDIKVVASDNHGNAAEAWISGKDFYLKKESGVLR